VSTQPKRELERIWREKLRTARDRYREATVAFQKTWDENFDLHLAVDPTHAIQQARKIESEALDQYVRVLKIYTDLVLHGKIPEEK
jgi:hypothetical protein